MKNITEKNRVNKYKYIYIGMVCLIFSAIYLPIILSGKAYIYYDIGADTYCNYWPAISYVKSLLKDFKIWDMGIGLGAPNITYICCFLLDPFNWICFLFDTQNMDIGLFISLILKNIAIAYLAYKYFEIKGLNGYPRIIAAITVTFSGWVVGWGQHYEFATIYVYFLAIIYFFEKWMRDNKFIGVIISTMLLAFISPYFCYMVLLFMIFYYFISLYYKYKKEEFALKKFIIHALKTAGIFIAGLGCSAIAFLPYAGDLFSSPRVSGSLAPSLKLADMKEYATIILRMFSNNILGINEKYLGYSNYYESPFMYIGIISIFGIALILWDRKIRKNKLLIIGFIAFALVFNNFSAIVFNGFSTKTYRWTFIFIPVVVLGCGIVLENCEIQKHKRYLTFVTIILDVVLSIYIFLNRNYMDKIKIISSISIFIILNASYLGFVIIKNRCNLQKFLLIMISIDLCVNGYISVNERNLMTIKDKDEMAYFDDSNKAIEYLKNKDNTFYRLSKNYAQIDVNDSMIQNYNGEHIYSSLFTAEVWDMMDLFDLKLKNTTSLYGFGDKQILRDICVGKYRLSKVSNEYYGYDMVQKVGNVYIYQNKNVSDFGLIYNYGISRSAVNPLDEFEMQNVLLEKCIIQDNEIDGNMSTLIDNNLSDLVELKKIITVEGDSTNDLVLDQKNRNPLLIKVKGLNAVGNVVVYTQESGTEAADNYDYNFNNGNEEIYVDDLNIEKIVILNSEGNIDSIDVYEINEDELTSKMTELNENHMEINKFTDCYITGKVSTKSRGVLFLPIPHDKSWHVYVNDDETQIYRANGGFMAVILNSGDSKITIKYESPYIKMGCIVSFSTILILIIICIINGRKRKNDQF